MMDSINGTTTGTTETHLLLSHHRRNFETQHSGATVGLQFIWTCLPFLYDRLARLTAFVERPVIFWITPGITVITAPF
ncbi:hypothetical protein BLNAU_1860 [Blattamonas nauphoetae]|uniref:Uncharacterized protein n=1 Tax=Blattamonas nauphoetae TaxID=2049346 RepID=A0ABQ9YHT9_9EUKA|nr:hypothetical protein BLNAU_1860 [Blattamonas nauphoetae]